MPNQKKGANSGSPLQVYKSFCLNAVVSKATARGSRD